VKYYSAIKKNEIMSFVGKWKELEIIMLSEICQTDKQNITCSFLCAESTPKKKKNGLGKEGDWLQRDQQESREGDQRRGRRMKMIEALHMRA
jgi:hypothetical protein